MSYFGCGRVVISPLFSMKKLLSGTDVPDELALWVGRFVMYFSYLEFNLWLWYNEIYDDEEKAKVFVDKMISGKAGATKGGLEKLNMKSSDRKILLEFIDRVLTLAISRNLVCHNPYLTLGGRKGERDRGTIFGVRGLTRDINAPIAKAKIADIRRFAEQAFALCGECHRLFPILQSGLPPKK